VYLVSATDGEGTKRYRVNKYGLHFIEERIAASMNEATMFFMA
jgi:hypothetical protein